MDSRIEHRAASPLKLKEQTTVLLFEVLPSSVGDAGQCIPCALRTRLALGLACDLSQPEALESVFGRPGMCLPTDESIARALAGLPHGEDAGYADASATDASASGATLTDANVVAAELIDANGAADRLADAD